MLSSRLISQKVNVRRIEDFKLYIDDIEQTIFIDAQDDDIIAETCVEFSGNLFSDNGYSADTGFASTLYAVAGTYETIEGEERSLSVKVAISVIHRYSVLLMLIRCP